MTCSVPHFRARPRYLELSQRAEETERRESLAALAKTWSRLAAELEYDQALLNALSQLSFDEPSYAMAEALNLTAAKDLIYVSADFASHPPGSDSGTSRGAMTDSKQPCRVARC